MSGGTEKRWIKSDCRDYNKSSWLFVSLTFSRAWRIHYIFLFFTVHISYECLTCVCLHVIWMAEANWSAASTEHPSEKHSALLGNYVLVTQNVRSSSIPFKQTDTHPALKMPLCLSETEGEVPRSKEVKPVAFLLLLSLPLSPYRPFSSNRVTGDKYYWSIACVCPHIVF